MTSLYTVQGWVSLDMPASLLRPDTSNSKSFDQQWRSCDAWPTDTLPIQRKNDCYRHHCSNSVELVMMLHLSNTMQGKVSCSQQSCCDSDRTELYGQIIFGDFVLQIRCLWAGLSHLHQWKQAHSFISGPREVTSTLSNESCFDS